MSFTFSPPMQRILSLFVSLIGVIINFAFAIQFLSAWRSLRWEPESEWEGSENGWHVDGVKLVWGLLSGYFVVTATICVVGVVGIVKVCPPFWIAPIPITHANRREYLPTSVSTEITVSPISASAPYSPSPSPTPLFAVRPCELSFASNSPASLI